MYPVPLDAGGCTRPSNSPSVGKFIFNKGDAMVDHPGGTKSNDASVSDHRSRSLRWRYTPCTALGADSIERTAKNINITEV